MQSRLEVCSRSLKEVEQKLRQMLLTVPDSEARRVGAEALRFVQEALHAVSRAQHSVELLRSERKQVSIAQSV